MLVSSARSGARFLWATVPFQDAKITKAEEDPTEGSVPYHIPKTC